MILLATRGYDCSPWICLQKKHRFRWLRPVARNLSYSPKLSGIDLSHISEYIITLLSFFQSYFFRIEIKNEGVIKETHIKEFMRILNVFRNTEMFCDFTLIVEDEVKIPVHRIVMMACSEYIRALLTYETCDDKVDSARLPDLTSTGVQAVVSFAYTGELEMYEDTVLEVLAAASFLQVVGVVTLCD